MVVNTNIIRQNGFLKSLMMEIMVEKNLIGMRVLQMQKQVIITISDWMDQYYRRGEYERFIYDTGN